VVANLTKIFLAQAKKRGAVELCIASDEIVRMRMECLAIFVVPRFLSVVLRVEVNRACAPVVIIGTGAGGGTLAYALAGTGKRILL